MDLIKRLIFKLFLIYFNYFPINRGKDRISKFITAIIGEVDIKTKENIWLQVLPYSPMDRSYFQTNNISHQLINKEIEKLNLGDVFVDIGSNVGYFTFIASRAVGSKGFIYSFEPSAREYIRLIAGINLNRAKNIIPFNCALSDQNEILKFEINKFHTGLNRFQEVGSEPFYSITVPTFRGDYLINQLEIHLVKIDVEGAEFRVIKGLETFLKERKIKKIIVEITPAFLSQFGDTKEDIYSFLNHYKFEPLKNSDGWQYDEIFVLKTES